MVGVLDDQRGVCLESRALVLADRQSPEEKLRMAPDHGDGRLHVVPGHAEDVFPQPFKLALPRDVAEHDDAALRGAFRRTEHGCAQAQDAQLARAELDLHSSVARARPESIDDGDKGCGDFARGYRPLLEPLLLEGLAEHEARTVEAEELSGRPVQSHDGAPCVYDEEGVAHGREDGLQL